MNELQIQHLLWQDPFTRPIVKKVCPRNRLPVHLSLKPHDPPVAYVVNLDPAHLPGSHWVALYLDPVNGGEYFDSYGSKPIPECSRLLQSCPRASYNSVMLQEDTLVCGQYCVVYLMLRCRGRSFDKIIQTLHHPNNDPLVHAFVHQFYPKLPFSYAL